MKKQCETMSTMTDREQMDYGSAEALKDWKEIQAMDYWGSVTSTGYKGHQAIILYDTSKRVVATIDCTAPDRSDTADMGYYLKMFYLVLDEIKHRKNSRLEVRNGNKRKRCSLAQHSGKPE